MENNTPNLFVASIWGGIWQELIRNYPQIIQDPDKTAEYQDKYQAEFIKFENAKMINVDAVLNLKEYFENGKRFVKAAAYNKEFPDGYSLRGTPYAEWKGLDVSPEMIKQFCYDEIMAHVLYEMAWDKFSAAGFGIFGDELDRLCRKIRL
jgi:hypothetical protein